VTNFWQGGDPELLSAESVCVPVTGGVNRGGSPKEALEQLVAAGACHQSYWPNNVLDSKQAKDGWKVNAKRHRIIKYLIPENFGDQMTLAFHRIPHAAGLGWWRHLVCIVDPIYLDDLPELDGIVRASGQFGMGFWNSWGEEYGEGGYAILDEEHATADLGAFAPIAMWHDIRE